MYGTIWRNGGVGLVYPLVVAVITSLFAKGVWRDYSRRRRPYQALWFISLVASAVASASFAVAVLSGAEWAFKLYYVGGALIAGAFMGMGSLYLVLPPAWARTILTILAVLSVAGTVLLFAAPIGPEALSGLAGTSGREVLARGPWQGVVVLHNVFGAAAVIGVAVQSAIRAVQKSGENRSFAFGNFLIALGIIVVSAAGSAAKWFPRWDGSFWTAMGLGWLIAYIGFRVVTTALESSRSALQSSDAVVS